MSMEEGQADEHLVRSCLERVRICIWCQWWRLRYHSVPSRQKQSRTVFCSKHLEWKDGICFTGGWICKYTGKPALCFIPSPHHACLISALCCLCSTLTVYSHTPSIEGKRLCSGLPIRHGEGWDAEEPGIQPQSPSSKEQ